MARPRPDAPAAAAPAAAALAAAALAAACDFTPRVHKDILDAQALVTERRHGEAAALYERILEKGPPEAAKIHYQLGELYSIYLDRPGDALGHYDRAIEAAHDPLWTVKSEERAAETLFSFVGDHDRAAERYRRLASFSPRLARRGFYQHRLAASLMGAGRLGEARSALEDILREPGHPHRADALYRMGLCRFLARDWAGAVSWWERHVREEGRRDLVVRTRFLMANAHEMMEDLRTAYAIYSSVLTSYPNADVVRGRLESIYARRAARRR